jgi:hypothetical protein
MILVLAKISKGNFGNGGLPDGGKYCAVLSRLAASISPTKTHTLLAGENAADFGAIHPKCDLSYFSYGVDALDLKYGAHCGWGFLCKRIQKTTYCPKCSLP